MLDEIRRLLTKDRLAPDSVSKLADLARKEFLDVPSVASLSLWSIFRTLVNERGDGQAVESKALHPLLDDLTRSLNDWVKSEEQFRNPEAMEKTVAALGAWFKKIP